MDFDRELDAHGSLQLFMDVRNTQRSSSKSREPWKAWATKNRARHSSHVLVSSSIMHMAISVIAMASKTVTTAYANEAAFLRELQGLVPGTTALAGIPAWVTETLAAASSAK